MASLIAIHPRLEEHLREFRSDNRLRYIEVKAFKKRKAQLLQCEAILKEIPEASSDKQLEVIDEILHEREQPSDSQGIGSRVLDAIRRGPQAIFTWSSESPMDIFPCNDTEFLRRLNAIASAFPALVQAINDVITLAIDHFSRQIQTVVNHTARKFEDYQRSETKRQLKTKRDHIWSRQVEETRQEFLQTIKSEFSRDPKK